MDLETLREGNLSSAKENKENRTELKSKSPTRVFLKKGMAMKYHSASPANEWVYPPCIKTAKLVSTKNRIDPNNDLPKTFRIDLFFIVAPRKTTKIKLKYTDQIIE